MDVDGFIAAHRAEWQWLEQTCAGGSRGLRQRRGPEIDRVVRAYLQTSAHLAEVRTRYRDPDLADHLEHIVATAHGAIYGVTNRSRREVAAIFGRRYREALRTTAPFIGLAALLLVGTAIVVGIWTALSPEAQAGLVPGFARSVLSESSVDPRDPSAATSGFIFFNNARVALMAFAFGVTLCLGTIFVLVTNGIDIGILGGAAVAFGGGPRFFALVLPHGFLELFAIAIAGGAGLRVGWSIIAPGDRRRSLALADETRDAVLVVLGVIPAFAFAAAIEGLLTGVTSSRLFEITFGGIVTILYGAWLWGRSEPSSGLDVEVGVEQRAGEPVG